MIAELLTGEEDLTRVREVRIEVFVKEQGIPLEAELDNKDIESFHVLVVDDENGDKPVGVSRLYEEDGKFHAGRFAVLKEYRGMGIGTDLVGITCEVAFRSGADEVFVNAQKQAVGFYERLGFAQCGEEFVEANLPHIPLSLKIEDFYEDGCDCGCDDCASCHECGDDCDCGCDDGCDCGCDCDGDDDCDCGCDCGHCAHEE